MPRLTVTEVAARVGVHKSTVSRQARAAGLVGADGLIDLDEYSALRATSIDPALQTTARPAARIAPLASPSAGQEPESAIAQERLRKLRADADAAEDAARLRRGELVDAQQVDAATEDAFRQIRDRLLELPRELADDCARLGDAAAIEGRLTQAIRTTLRELSALLTTEPALVDAA